MWRWMWNCSGWRVVRLTSPWRWKVCEQCGKSWQTRSPKARTCSPTCRARLRELEHGPTKGAPPRDYPEEVVEKIKDMYESGKTISEIQREIRGIKVQNVISRYGIETRSTAKRNQLGERNDSWKGDNASYTAFHLRVYKARGKPSECSVCGVSTPGRYEWANLSGHYEDINDYARMCVTCHKSYDARRRLETGRRTSPARR